MMRVYDIVMALIVCAAVVNTFLAGRAANRLYEESQHFRRLSQINEQLRLVHEKRAETYRAYLIESQGQIQRINTFGGAG